MAEQSPKNRAHYTRLWSFGQVYKRVIGQWLEKKAIRLDRLSKSNFRVP